MYYDIIIYHIFKTRFVVTIFTAFTIISEAYSIAIRILKPGVDESENHISFKYVDMKFRPRDFKLHNT